MCRRFALQHSHDQIAARFRIPAIPSIFRTGDDFSPTQYILGITQENGVRLPDGLHWGLIPSWAKDMEIGAQMMHAPVEMISEKTWFRTALLRRRCLIPADGFYAKDANKKVVCYRRPDNAIFAFAGLWDRWYSPDGSEIHSCSIITTHANVLLALGQTRMPAILAHDTEDTWLDASQSPEDLMPLLLPYPADLLVSH